MTDWEDSIGNPDLQPEDFIDCGDTVLVRARELQLGKTFWFRYTLEGPRIVGWDVHDSEGDARQAAGV